MHPAPAGRRSQRFVVIHSILVGGLWGDVVAGSLGDHLLVRIEFDDADEQGRDLVISATGRTWAARWDELTSRLAAFAC